MRNAPRCFCISPAHRQEGGKQSIPLFFAECAGPPSDWAPSFRLLHAPVWNIDLLTERTRSAAGGTHKRLIRKIEKFLCSPVLILIPTAQP